MYHKFEIKSYAIWAMGVRRVAYNMILKMCKEAARCT